MIIAVYLIDLSNNGWTSCGYCLCSSWVKWSNSWTASALTTDPICYRISVISLHRGEWMLCWATQMGWYIPIPLRSTARTSLAFLLLSVKSGDELAPLVLLRMFVNVPDHTPDQEDADIWVINPNYHWRRSKNKNKNKNGEERREETNKFGWLPKMIDRDMIE